MPFPRALYTCDGLDVPGNATDCGCDDDDDDSNGGCADDCNGANIDRSCQCQ